MKTNTPRGRSRIQLTEGNTGNKGRQRELLRPSSLPSFPAIQTARSCRQRRLHVERLEERTVLSSFAVSFGGTADDKLHPAPAIDPEQNSYLPGFFRSQPADFDPGSGALHLSSVGGSDAFIAKYSSSGSLAWARTFGGSGEDQARRASFSRELDGDFVYVAGTFNGNADFGPGVGVLGSDGGTDVFLLKLDAISGTTVWATSLGGSVSDLPSDLSIVNGKVYVTGIFNGIVDFDPGAGVSSLDSTNGGNFVWTLNLQGGYESAWQHGAYIASIVVEDNSLYLRGQFSGTADFDPGPGTELRTSTVNNHFWTGKYSEAGALNWVQTLEISVLSSGNLAHDATSLYVATTDYYQSTQADVVAASFRKSDGAVLWSKRFGTPTDSEYASTCVINPATGALYLGGNFYAPNVDFNSAAPGGDLYNAGGTDAFVLKLSAASGDYQQVWQIGGPGYEGYARVHDARGTSVYVSGDFAATANFPSGDSLTSNGGLDGYFMQLDETDAIPPSPPPPKFYVVDDGSANKTFEYAVNGSAIENYTVNTNNSAPRGAASTAAGDKVWVVDANKKVYVYNTSGDLLGSWIAGSLPSNANVQGVTTNGADVWIVDAQSDKVYRYTGAATRLSGSQNAASSFNLNTSNKDATDLVTDGTCIWVVNNATGFYATDKVFKYTVGGSLLGSWTISSAGGSPTGITIDPSSVSHIWIVDSSTDRVYQFDAAASRTSGSQSPSTSFALAAGNTNPQGLADPPASRVGFAHHSDNNEGGHSPPYGFDAALLSVVDELHSLLGSGRKRK